MTDSRHISPDPLATLLADLPGIEQLAFTPVPVRARRDGWTAERQRGFVHRLALIGCVTAAARGVGMTKRSAYKLRDHPGAVSFCDAWDRALDWGREQSGDIAIARALEGERVPVMYNGRHVGERIRHDNRLLMAVLRAWERPRPRTASGSDLDACLNRLMRTPASTENKRLSRVT